MFCCCKKQTSSQSKADYSQNSKNLKLECNHKNENSQFSREKTNKLKSKSSRSCELKQKNYLKKRKIEYDNMINEVHENDAKKFRDMEIKINKSIGPPWYQELSERQMEAADLLFVGLRDDLEQGTVHRCFEILRKIGIYPIESSKNIQHALEMSRGNDIAFLWFFNEMFYTQSSNSFDRTEYSVNERLLISCICHLDMITTLRELERILPPLKPIEKPQPMRYIQTCKCKNFSPYLEPIPRPRIPVSCLLPGPKVAGPNFKPYLKYKDPDFVVNNETNRWYAKIDQEKTSQENLVEQHTSGQDIVDGIIKNQIQVVTSDSFDREAVINSLCKKHKNIEEKCNDLLMKLNKATKCHCKDITISPDPKDILHGKIVYQIELDMARTKEEFEELAKKYQTQTIVKILIRELIQNAYKIKNIKACKSCDDCRTEYMKYKKILDKMSEINRSMLDFEHDGKLKNDDKYFEKNTKNCPYLFNYEKIFSDDVLGSSDDPIKNGLRIALDLDKYATEEKAIEICLKDLWQIEYKLWNEKVKNDEKIDEENTSKKYINSCNPKLMRTLLKNALLKMRENPKFVLASIPHSHDLPILKQWILIRYGYKYTHDVRHSKLLKSRKYWDDLKKMDFHVDLPLRNEICCISKLNWNFKNYLEQSVHELLADYYRRLNFALIKECRQFWTSMETYLCAIPPREIFYAYLPACEYDVTAIRQWKVHEFRGKL